MYFEQQVIDFGKFGLRAIADKVSVSHENLQMPGNRDMPPPVDPACFANEMRDPVLKKLHVVAASKFHVFVPGLLGVQMAAERVNPATHLCAVCMGTK